MAKCSFAWIVASVAAFLSVARCQTISQAVCDQPALQWSFNSENKSPCQVSAELAGACNGGVFTIKALDDGFTYLGPDVFSQNSCRCNTVYYSMLSACAACQGEQWISWTLYNKNCTKIYPSVFPEPIPFGTSVPGWAYLDVRGPANSWNLTLAQSFDKLPESTGVASSTRAGPTSSRTVVAGPSAGASSSGSSSHAGAIAGGVVGGIAGLALIAGLVFFYLRRRRNATTQQSAYPTASYAPAPDDAAEQKMVQSDFPTSAPPYQPQRPYDPSDPTTFPIPSPVGAPSYNSGPYSPAPDSATFQSSGTHVAQHNMSSAPVMSLHPTGNYSGVPEL